MLLLVGCGKMGGALLEGWLAQGIRPEEIAVIDPGQPSRPARAGVQLTPARAGAQLTMAAPDQLPQSFVPEVVVLAVKPQSLSDVLPAYRPFADTAVFLSIAAGKTVAALERVLGSQTAIIRAMPNTPASVRAGITAAFANPRVRPAQRARCQALLEAVGAVEWVGDESLMDAVTAVSGSGPAYVFLLVEALAEAGEKAGLAPALAMRLARETVIGAGTLLKSAPESAETLRRNVTSPNGTTAAALSILLPELAPLMTRAVAAATERSRELAG